MSPEENKAIVRRWFAETDKGNDGIVEELCAPDYVDHNPPLPGMPEGSAGVRRPTSCCGRPSPTPSTRSWPRSPRGTRS